MMKRKVKRLITNMILLFGSLIFCYVGVEIFLRVFIGHTRLIDIYQYHATLGWVYRPGFKGYFVSGKKYQGKISINSKGLRYKEIDYKKPTDTYRILVVGDSFTAGLEVDNNQTYCARLEQLLNESQSPLRYEVINAGHRGWGTDQEYLFIRDEGIKYNPDMIIMHTNENDFNDILCSLLSKRMYYKPYFEVDEKGELLLKGIPTPRVPKNFYYFLNHRSRFITFVIQRFYRLRGLAKYIKDKNLEAGPKGDFWKAWRIYSSVLIALENYLESKKIEFLLITHEDIDQLLSRHIDRMGIETEASNSFHNMVSGYGTDHLHIIADSTFHIPQDGHFNEKGHYETAKQIYQFIENKYPLLLNR